MRLAAALWACLLLLPMQASALPAAERICAPWAGQRASLPLDDRQFVELRRRAPAQALAEACKRFDVGSAQSALPIAEALVELLDWRRATPLLAALRRRGLPPLLLARLSLAEGQMLSLSQQAAASLPLLRQARSALQANGAARSPWMAVALLFSAHAELRLQAAGGLERCSALLDEAEDLHRALGLGESLLQVDVDDTRSYLALARNDVRGALQLAQQLTDSLSSRGYGDDPALLQPLLNLVSLQLQLGDMDAAQASVERGLALLARHPQAAPDLRRFVHGTAARYFNLRGQHEQALLHAEQFVRLADQIWSEGSKLMLALTVRAETLMGLQRWGDARRDLERALQMGERRSLELGPWRWLRLHLALAQALVQLDEAEAAGRHIDAGLRHDRDADARSEVWIGRLLVQRGALHARRADWFAADRAYAEAQRWLLPVAGAVDTLPVAAARCQAQLHGKLDGDACPALLRLEGLDGARPYHRFLVFAVLGDWAERHGDMALALERRLLALAAAQHEQGPDPRWSALDALARQLRGSGRHAEAIWLAKQAVLDIEAMRSNLGADAQRVERGFLSDKRGVYARLADWLAEDGRIDEALAVLRLLKRDEFVDFVRRDARLSAGAAADGLQFTPGEAESRAQWALAAAAEALAGTRAQWLRLGEQQLQQARDWLQLLREPQALAAASARPPPALAPTASPPGVLRVWLFAGERQLNLLMQGPSGRELLRLPWSAAQLSRQTGQLLAELGRRAPLAELQPLLAELHAQIAQPMLVAAERQGLQQLELELSGALRYLPLAALSDGRSFLGGRVALVQRLEETGAAAPADGPLSVQALGVTRALAGLPALPALASEVCSIVRGPVLGLGADAGECPAGLLPGRGWLNERFTRERLARAATHNDSSRKVLHLGTHFVLRPGHMDGSWLLLGDGQRLRLGELAELDFSAQALVTLSACETGLGGAEGAGGEVEGLNRLVLRRGAAAVLASLWRVEDRSTAALMRHFYGALASGLAAPQALRQAQARLRAQARWAHPYYWAGFYLVEKRAIGS